MICLFCGKEIKNQVPILINSLNMSPISREDGSVGKDILTEKYCCQSCYADILLNCAKSSKEFSAICIKKHISE